MYTNVQIKLYFCTKMYNMRNLKRSEIAVEKLTRYWTDAASKTYQKNLSNIEFNENEYTKTPGDQLKSFVYTNMVLVEPELLSKLKPSALKIALVIIDQLCQNNALWYVDYKNLPDRSKRAITDLKNMNILNPLESANIFIINPNKIRKGALPTVIVATIEYVERKGQLNQDDIKPLRPPTKAQINQYYKLIQD